VGYLLKHGLEQHIDASVGFDHLLEFLDDWMQGLSGGVDDLDDATEPGSVNAVILWHPVAESVLGK
jgi:hypothetical protein